MSLIVFTVVIGMFLAGYAIVYTMILKLRMSGWLYLAAACVLGAIFIGYAIALYARCSDRRAQRCFRYSIAYLAALRCSLTITWRRSFGSPRPAGPSFH